MMPNLATLNDRFMVKLTVIEGGRGAVHGLLTETDQTQIPAYTFVNPRRILRTPFVTALRTGMVLRSPSGEVYIVGENGASDSPQGTIWQSWRLFEASGQFTWKRRTMLVDPVTHLDREGAEEDKGLIWVAIEPLDREAPDRRLRLSFEQDRFICGADIKSDDIINGKKVVRIDRVLGIKLGILTA